MRHVAGVFSELGETWPEKTYVLMTVINWSFRVFHEDCHTTPGSAIRGGGLISTMQLPAFRYC